MSRVSIAYYTSSNYKGSLPTCEMFKRTMLIAWGTLDGEEYTYATLSRTRPGVVPAEFISEAWMAFTRAAKRKDMENE